MMLTCISCSNSKQLNGRSLTELDEEDAVHTPSTKQALKALTAQIKDMAVKASGAYKNCKPCSGSSNRNGIYADSEVAASASERFHCSYRRTGSSNSTPRLWGKGMEAGVKGISSVPSSGEGTPVSVSGRAESVVFTEEDENKEWVAHVEPGVLITFVSLPQGENDLKKIRFSRDLFNKWQAQRWWTENYDRVMELYNVRESDSFSTPARSEDENAKVESTVHSPTTPPLNKECLPPNSQRPTGPGCSSSDSLDHHPTQLRNGNDSNCLASTPKLSSLSGAKTETSSVRSSSSHETDSEDPSPLVNKITDWIEEDEPGVYITIRTFADGTRELRRVRFSRERFGEMNARLWWAENRARIEEQYL